MKKHVGKLTLDLDNARLRRFGPYILAGLVTLLAISLYLDDHRALATWELGIQDVMVSLGKKPSPPNDVVVVTIDDNAVKKLGAWPWDPERVGYLVGMLAEYKPLAIGLDIEIAEETTEDPVGSRFLTDMIKKAGNVVLPLRFSLGDGGAFSSDVDEYIFKSSLVTFDQTMELMDEPYPQARRLAHPFEDACRAAWGMGQVNTWQDVDGRVRRDPLVVRFQGEYFPSMALQLAMRAKGIQRGQVHLNPGEGVDMGPSTGVIPCDDQGMFLIDYRGPAGTLKSVSAARVLEGDPLDKELTGKLVVVGVTAKGYGTTLDTPASEAMPRTEKIATVAANILSGRYITTVRLSTLFDLLIMVTIGAFCAIVLPRITILYRAIILLVMAFVFVDLNYVLYNSFQLITKTLYPTLQILLFLVVAPVMKTWKQDEDEARATADKPATKAPRTGQSGRVATAQGRGQHAAPTTGSNAIPTRVVREDGPAGAIGGLEKTMIVSGTGGLTEQQSEDTIHIDGAFEGGTASALMNQSPQPLGTNTSESDPSFDAVDLSEEFTGRKLGRYEILGVLGQGAMGTVYKGQDPAIDRMVALKTIRAGIGQDEAQAEQLRERLVREAKAAGKLSHPNIVTVYDVGAEGDLNYIAMEYLEGYTLEQMINKNVQLNYHIAAKIIMQVCAALEYAHKAGIVHRDIKPANIMVLDNFEIKVTDFGIARFDSPQMSMTQTGIAMGTPHYISPEQLRGENVDRRCDIFSLGVVAYELLTHRRPFAGENISQLIYSITQTTPPPPSQVDENIPGLFDMVIGRALAKDPLERYQSADQMAQDLKVFAQDMASSYRI